MPHTLHVSNVVQQEYHRGKEFKIQQRNPKGSTINKVKPQRRTCDVKNRKREETTKQTEIATVDEPNDRKQEKWRVKTKAVHATQASILQRSPKSREQHTQRDLEQGLQGRRRSVMMRHRNNTRQRGELNMLSGGAQREPNTSDLDKDNGDRRNYPPACNKSGIPRYHKTSSVMGPSHGYQDQDAYPLRHS